MLRDYEKRKLEISIIDNILAAVLDRGDNLDVWEERQRILQWLYNRRQGDVLEALSEEDAAALLCIITDGCDESTVFGTVKWLVNQVEDVQ